MLYSILLRFIDRKHLICACVIESIVILGYIGIRGGESFGYFDIWFRIGTRTVQLECVEVRSNPHLCSRYMHIFIKPPHIRDAPFCVCYTGSRRKTCCDRVF